MFLSNGVVKLQHLILAWNDYFMDSRGLQFIEGGSTGTWCHLKKGSGRISQEWVKKIYQTLVDKVSVIEFEVMIDGCLLTRWSGNANDVFVLFRLVELGLSEKFSENCEDLLDLGLLISGLISSSFFEKFKRLFSLAFIWFFWLFVAILSSISFSFCLVDDENFMPLTLGWCSKSIDGCRCRVGWMGFCWTR